MNFKALSVFASVVALALAMTAEAVEATQARLSGWDAGHKSQARLIALDQADTQTTALARARVDPFDETISTAHVALAGLEIELAPGYKTYWRHPGSDGGIPPEFDWSRSDNVASVRVGYPAPVPFQGETGMSIGYKGGVMFPLVVVPIDPRLPSTLRLSLFYGVCMDICIPAEANLELPLVAAAGTGGTGLRFGPQANTNAAATSGPAAIAAVRLVETIHTLPQPMSELGPDERPRIISANVRTSTKAVDSEGTKTLDLVVAMPEGERPMLVVERGDRRAPVVTGIGREAPPAGDGSGDGVVTITGLGDDLTQVTVTILSPSRSVVATVPLR